MFLKVRFAVALLATALSLRAREVSTDDWQELRTPQYGESLRLTGSQIEAATLDTKAIEAFISSYRESNDDNALNLAAIAFDSNHAIPDSSCEPLRVFLAPFRGTDAPGPQSRYLIPFKRSGQAGYQNLLVDINWDHRIVANIVGVLPIRRTEKRTLEEALTLFKNHTLLEGAQPTAFLLTARFYGDQTIILSRSMLTPEIAPLPDSDRYYLEARLHTSRIYKFDATTIARLVANELTPIEAADRLRAIKAYIQLYAPESTLIGSLHDVPGYKKHPADDDIARAVRPMFQAVDVLTGNTIVVCYTYQQLGGELTRLRFSFTEDSLNEVQVLPVGRMVGDAQILM